MPVKIPAFGTLIISPTTCLFQARLAQAQPAFFAHADVAYLILPSRRFHYMLVLDLLIAFSTVSVVASFAGRQTQSLTSAGLKRFGDAGLPVSPVAEVIARSVAFAFNKLHFVVILFLAFRHCFNF